MTEYCWDDWGGIAGVDGGAEVENGDEWESVDASASLIVGAAWEVVDSCMVLPSASGCTRDSWRIDALLFPKFSCSQFGLAMYSLPHPVFAKARGICLRRLSDDLVELEAWSEGGEGFMLVFAWWYIGVCAWEEKEGQGDKRYRYSNDVVGKGWDSCLVSRCILGESRTLFHCRLRHLFGCLKMSETEEKLKLGTLYLSKLECLRGSTGPCS